MSLHSPEAVSHFQEQVLKILDKHLTRFEALHHPVTPESFTKKHSLAEKIYARLTSHRFCRHRPDDDLRFLSVIEAAISQEAPIPVILGHGPLKNPNNCEVSQADWAEFFTLSNLTALHQSVRKLYNPGLQVSLYLDDARSERANGIPAQRTNAYRESLVALVEALSIQSLVSDVFSLKVGYERFKVEAYQNAAEEMVRAWEQDPGNLDALETQRLHARKNLPVLPDSEPDAISEAEAAAHRYRVCLQAEILSGLWSQPGVLYGRFSHHPGFWQIFTLRKGSVSQPWQGQGCLKLNPNGKMEPFLLTQSRTDKYDLLDSFDTGLQEKGVSRPGFDRIAVVSERSTPLTPTGHAPPELAHRFPPVHR